MKKKLKIAIFASHNGSNLPTLYNACANNEFNANIEVIITNNTNANVLEKAKQYDIPSYIVNDKNYPNVSKQILSILQNYDCEYILLMGYMKKISSELINNYKIINSHPSLLPAYGGTGMYGEKVHKAVIKNKEVFSGVSIHFVNENYDEGEIILQEKLLLNKDETSQSLEIRIKELETKSIIKALKICLK